MLQAASPLPIYEPHMQISDREPNDFEVHTNQWSLAEHNIACYQYEQQAEPRQFLLDCSEGW